MIIAIEGLDGAGKHTQTVLALKALIDRGIDATTGSFPRYGVSYYSAFIQEYLNGDYGNPADVHPVLAGELFIQERAEMKEWIKAKNDSSQIFIIDRYSPSNIAYQVAKVKDGDRWVLAQSLVFKEHIKLGVPRPDVIIYLKWPVESCVGRIRSRALLNNRPEDEIEKNVNYLRAVGLVYADTAFWHQQYPAAPYIIIDCQKDGKDMTASEISEQLVTKILNYYTARI